MSASTCAVCGMGGYWVAYDPDHRTKYPAFAAIAAGLYPGRT